jgi:arginyl-tRNA synthetase
MADPLLALTPPFQLALRAAFGDEWASEGPVIRRSDRADYQADIALGLAKKLGRPPREVAAALLEHLDLSAICSAVEIAGPGFINLTLRDEWLAERTARLLTHARLDVEASGPTETVVVDYSSPNVAKEMHVGHLRSTIIGDALVRVLEFLGHRVIRQNHLGDWGTPFGMLIEHLIDAGEDAYLKVSAADLESFYKQARAKFDADPGFAERSRRRVVLLQGGDVHTLALWNELMAQSKRYLSLVYERLGVSLREADIRGESFYNPLLDGVVRDLDEKGLLVTSDGASCVFPSGFTNKANEPLPLIVRKQDGGYGYAATDLAAVRYRTGELGATRVLVVVGAPQQQHLAMVNAVARDAGWLVPPARAEHVAFGSVLGADKKMFKTRSGENIKLISLLDEAVQRALAIVAEKNPGLDARTQADVARQIGIGAVKYADLSSDRVKDYVFDWQRMLAFDGNSAPYLQYAHARIRSIFRRGGVEPASLHEQGATLSIEAPAERALALELMGFGAAVRSVADSLQPHRMCTYLYTLATRFSTFFEQCPVLNSAPETRASRLLLCELSARTLSEGLGLLGIEAPDQM